MSLFAKKTSSTHDPSVLSATSSFMFDNKKSNAHKGGNTNSDTAEIAKIRADMQQLYQLLDTEQASMQNTENKSIAQATNDPLANMLAKSAPATQAGGKKRKAPKKGSRKMSRKGSKKGSKKGSQKMSRKGSKKGSKKMSRKGSKKASKKGSKKMSDAMLGGKPKAKKGSRKMSRPSGDPLAEYRAFVAFIQNDMGIKGGPLTNTFAAYFRAQAKKQNENASQSELNDAAKKIYADEKKAGKIKERFEQIKKSYEKKRAEKKEAKQAVKAAAKAAAKAAKGMSD